MAAQTFVDKVTVVPTAWLNDVNTLTWTVFNGKSTAGTAGTLLRSDGTNIVNTTATYPATTTANQLLYSSATNTISGLTSANSSVLVTNGSGVPAFSTTLPDGILATTQVAGDNTTKVATTAFVNTASIGVNGATWDTRNLTVTATVAANALTIAFKTGSGADASASDPIAFKFQNTPDSNGGNYTVINLTAASSITISSGSTLGTQNNIPARIYFGMFNDVGTLRPFVYNPYNVNGPFIRRLHENLGWSSTAEGGAGGADSNQIIYTTTAVTGRRLRVLGYIETTQTIAGTWVAAVDKVHLLKYGDLQTGDIIQVRPAGPFGNVATGSTIIPADNTIPQNTEGNEYMTASITPLTTMSILEVEADAQLYVSISAVVTGALFKDSDANAVAAFNLSTSGAANFPLHIKYRTQSNTLLSTTYKFRAGPGGATTITFNGSGGTQLYGGVMASNMSITEYFI